MNDNPNATTLFDRNLLAFLLILILTRTRHPIDLNQA